MAELTHIRDILSNIFMNLRNEEMKFMDKAERITKWREQARRWRSLRVDLMAGPQLCALYNEILDTMADIAEFVLDERGEDEQVINGYSHIGDIGDSRRR